jgi:hypothetical protein
MKHSEPVTCKTCVWYKSDKISKPCGACFGKNKWVSKIKLDKHD